MAGAFKKTMIYLGLADGEEYDEDFGAQQGAGAPAASRDAAAASSSRPAAESPRVAGERSAARPTAEPPATSAVRAGSSGDGSEVVELGAAGQSSARGSASAGEHNSSSLAVDPEYRAPVTPIKRAPSSRDESSSMRRITTVHPRSYNDAKVIGESFRDDVPVIMNVTEMGEAEAKRLVDFSAGLVFGLGGSIERVTNKVFLLTPKNVEVVADERGAVEPDSSAQFFNQS
ncbi:cell division protein SepF [Nesterenkonia halobia]|uniref:Cell division protein SepF n=1 Tax=Nesterenkonia halobia TaxID=37922 RepID=A0ABP6RKD4_9MICC